MQTATAERVADVPLSWAILNLSASGSSEAMAIVSYVLVLEIYPDCMMYK